MNIGFIGAGKVGYTLGKYFTMHGFYITGYFSRNEKSALDAAEFTHSKQYETVSELVKDSDVLFLTVPDGTIETIWKQIKLFPLKGKIICHCSGAMSSAVFSEIDRVQAYGYSIHPFFAISNKYQSYKELSRALITIEGAPKHLADLQNLLNSCGNRTQIISAAEKTKYHAAGAIGSNLMIGLLDFSIDLLVESGFSRKNALLALKPLVEGNLQAAFVQGEEKALTGPVERNDCETVQKHLEVLSGEERELYRLLSKRVLEIARNKNADRDYSKMEGRLRECNIR